MDFGKASMKAAPSVISWFPTKRMPHFILRLWKRIQTEVLTNNYCDDENVRIFLKIQLPLSFISTQDISHCFDELKYIRPGELESVHNYWEDTYVERLIGTQRSLPVFCVDFWKV